MIRRLAPIALLALWPALASAQFATIAPTPPTADNGDRIATTAWVNNFVNAGLPLANITGLGTGVAVFLATPTSANLRAALTDETGAGPAVFGTSPNITTPTGIVKGDVGLGNVANVDTTNAANISSGTLPAGRLPALTGDCTTTIGTVATTCGLINTWTPTIIGTSTPGTGQTYSTQTGTYQKIGREVVLHFSVIATSLGTAAGNVQVGGLPFTATSTANIFGECVMVYGVAGLAASSFGVIGMIQSSATAIDLLQNNATGSVSITIAQAGAAAAFRGTCTYQSP